MTNAQMYQSPSSYEIEVNGNLDEGPSGWFDGFTVTQEDGKTLLVGQVIDQAALHGTLARINDLGLVILSVKRIDPEIVSDQKGV